MATVNCRGAKPFRRRSALQATTAFGGQAKLTDLGRLGVVHNNANIAAQAFAKAWCLALGG